VIALTKTKRFPSKKALLVIVIGQQGQIWIIQGKLG
jgi:hypothetical protein